MRRSRNTKESIFNEAVRLFAEKGYEAATVKNIASAVGVNEASIYRHYENKADILDTVLDEFRFKLRTYTPAQKQIDALVERETPQKVLEEFVSFWDTNDEFMRLAFRIVFIEQFTNEKARDMVVDDLHAETARSLRYALDKLIEMGKLQSCDTKAFATMWVMSVFSETVLQANEIVGTSTGKYMIDVVLNGTLPGSSYSKKG